MVEIAIKRVYEPAVESDGFRVLVDRLWPRGLKKEDVKYDLWAKGLAPSTSLRKWFHEDPGVRWTGFARKYTEELASSSDAAGFIRDMQGEKKITLVHGARSAVHNHALILQDFLEKHLK